MTPEQLGWLFSAEPIGGPRWFLGPAAGGALFVVPQHVASRFTLSHGLVLGVLLIAVIRACPGGVAEATARVLGWTARPGRPWTRPTAP